MQKFVKMNPQSPNYIKNTTFMINDILRSQTQERLLQEDETMKSSRASHPFLLLARNQCNSRDLFPGNRFRLGVPPSADTGNFRLPPYIDELNPYIKNGLGLMNSPSRYLPRASASDLMPPNCVFPPFLAASAMNPYLPLYLRNRFLNFTDTVAHGGRKCRRSRTVFSELQLMALEERFKQQKYLSTPDRMELADGLGLTQLQVKTWYQNRRMKWKKQVQQKDEGKLPSCDSSKTDDSNPSGKIPDSRILDVDDHTQPNSDSEDCSTYESTSQEQIEQSVYATTTFHNDPSLRPANHGKRPFSESSCQRHSRTLAT